MKRCFGVVAIGAAIGCGSATARGDGAVATDPQAFVGAWRSVTPSLEFVRLSVYSVSSRQGVVTGRLTLSGAEFDASGRPDADSVVASLTTVGGGVRGGTLALHVTPNETLTAQLRPVGAPARNLLFVRE